MVMARETQHKILGVATESKEDAVDIVNVYSGTLGGLGASTELSPVIRCAAVGLIK